MVVVYIDISSNGQVGGDSYKPHDPFDNTDFADVGIELTSQTVNISDDCDIPNNEDEEPGIESNDNVERVNNIVHFNDLQQLTVDKKLFKAHVMNYFNKILLNRLPEDKKDELKQKIQSMVQFMLKNFDNSEIYVSAQAKDLEDISLAMPIFAYWKGEEHDPRFVYFKHGIEQQKY